MTNREKEKYMIFTKIGIENYRAIEIKTWFLFYVRSQDKNPIN